MDPGTILSDDEIDYFDDSEDEMNEKVHTKKERQQTSKVFAEGFFFDEEDPFLDPLGLESGLTMVKKRQRKTLTLDEKIKAVLEEEHLKQPIKEEEDKMELDDEGEKGAESEEDVIDELHETLDKVRVKKSSVKKREVTDDDFFEEFVKPEEAISSFTGFNFDRALLKALNGQGWQAPTEIQSSAIPVAMAGRDICACATTGSGKTGAFVLPILQRFAMAARADTGQPRGGCTRVLVLLPTRELCVQVFAVFKKLSADIDNCEVACAAGGLDLQAQTAALRREPDILVATPGRLIDHLHNTPNFSLRDLEILVLDEADRMLDEFFASQMKEILVQTGTERQTLLFSATMSEKVRDLVAVSLKNPVKIFISSNTDVARGLEQQFVRIREGREGDREAICAALLTRYFPKYTLLFTQTKRLAHRMHIVLGLIGLKVAELHGSLSQTQRLESLAAFKSGRTDILICTDVAARGLDIPSVRTVINMTLPNNYKSYVHRVGRTARAGARGKSISLVGEQERFMLKTIHKSASAALKARNIDADIVAQFRTKLVELESKVKKIIVMENEESSIRAAENQINRVENRLEGGAKAQKRDWYQTRYEKELEKAQAMLDRHSGIKNRNTRDKKVIRRADTAEERAQREVEKANAFRRREEKRSKKGNRLRAVGSEAAQASLAKAKAIAKAKTAGSRKKTKSAFSRDLGDISGKNVKRTRFTANADRSANTKGRGAKKGAKVPKKGGKVGKRGK